MKKMVSSLLSLIGVLIYYIQRVNNCAVKEYKTRVFRKRNPGILYVGGKTTWNLLDHITVGANTYINGAELTTTEDSFIKIGRDCLVSYDVVMRTDSHKISDSTTPIIEQGNYSKDIIIGDDVWIGYGAFIMPGVSIGNHVIIGAKAVVTENIPDYSVAVGIPAKVIKKRWKT